MSSNATAGLPGSLARTALWFALTVSCALAAVGCAGDDGLVATAAPSPTVVPAPPSVPPGVVITGDLWSLSTRIVSVEGSACFWQSPVGAIVDNWTLSVERNGPQVRLVYDVYNPHDNLLFVGELQGDTFIAASDRYPGWWPCAGNLTYSSSVIGSFSPDGQRLSARERLTYRLDAGGELTATLEWTATPK